MKVNAIFHKILRRVFNIVFNIFFYIVFLFRKSPHRKTKYYFSICSVFKNEARYLKEWIEFHKLIGVDHIFLYNNFSTDNYKEILQPYIDNNYVTLKEWPFENGQVSAFYDCYNNNKNDTFWMTFIDSDEFICPVYETNIKKWIKKYEKYPSIIMYWMMFGTNGIIDYNPNKLVIEQYTQSWGNVEPESKVILNTYFVPVKMYQHIMACWIKVCGINLKVYSINENKHFVTNHGREKCPRNGTIQLNHYWSKCLNEYIKKINRGSAFSKKNDKIRKDISFFYAHENRNIEENKVIFRFLIKLKVEMNQIDFSFNKIRKV